MARRLLTGVAVEDNWLSLVGALAGAARFLGGPADPIRLAGLSGAAFRLPLPLREGEVAAPDAEACFDPKLLAQRLATAGWKASVLLAWPDEGDAAKRRAEAIKQVRRSLDHGRPALVYGLHLPRFGLVKGYDDQGERWAVSTMLSGQYGESLPLVRWPAPETAAPIAVVLLDSATKVDARMAVVTALREAVRYAEAGEARDPSGALHGLVALERWAAAFAAGEPVSRAGNATLVQLLQSARRDAATFLRGEAARRLPAASAVLAEAAAAYDAEVLALSRMLTMFPYPSGGDPTNPASRLVAAGALRTMLAQEQAALAALRRALGG